MKKHERFRPPELEDEGEPLDALPLWKAARSSSDDAIDAGATLPVTRPTSRRGDPSTSKAAGKVATHKLAPLQTAVLEAYAVHGKLTARQAEELERFADYSPSTIRKRISELSHEDGPRLLVKCGTDTSRRSPCAIFELSEAGRATIGVAS